MERLVAEAAIGHPERVLEDLSRHLYPGALRAQIQRPARVIRSHRGVLLHFVQHLLLRFLDIVAEKFPYLVEQWEFKEWEEICFLFTIRNVGNDYYILYRGIENFQESCFV